MKTLLIFLLCFFCVKISSAQLNAVFDTTLNTNCLGQPCDYEGPTILINELMISPLPTSIDGSISGPNGFNPGRGEWIELYNPNLCEPVDISCYYLGNSTSEGQGGVRLPDNLIVPPGGFVMVRGVNVNPVPAELLVENGGNVIEVVVPANINDDGVCSTGPRVWFPNLGGWFAFYNELGEPQDAVSWGNQASIQNPPCSATSIACPNAAGLPSYNDIPNDRKFFASSQNASNHANNTIRRIPDGGPWTGTGAPTYATCNSLPCATVGESTCTGTATVNVTGGQPPYTYLWNDSQLQMTQTATGLCGETYEVLVTDANGVQATFEVQINDYVPTVTLNIAAEYCDYDDAVNLVNYTPVPNADQTGFLVGDGVDNFVFTPGEAGAGQHTLVYTFTDENGCTNSAQDQITVHPTPEVSMDVAGAYCLDEPAFLLTNVTPPTGGPTGNGVISGPGVTNAGLNSTFFTANAAGVGTHTITYTFTSIHGCVNSVTDEITVHPLPIVSLDAATALCEYDDEIEITATGSPGAQGPDGSGVFTGSGVSSSGGSFFFDPETAGPGTHTITYTFTSAEGCVGTATDQIIVHNTPVIDLTANPLEAFVPANFTFTNNSTWSNNFTWFFGDGNSLESNANQVIHLYNQEGTYTIVLLGENNGCFNSDSVEITLYDPIQYEIPNVFSPNGDDINPFFNLINFSGFEKVDKFEFLILNRWGNVITVITDKYFQWDGKGDNGADVPEGVYFYKLYMTSEFGDVYENHGFFHLIR